VRRLYHSLHQSWFRYALLFKQTPPRQNGLPPSLLVSCRMTARKQEWLAKGHGEFREITEREFFGEMKGEERMICLFYRESIPCQAMDRRLGDMAKAHLETKFVKVHAEKAPFLSGENLTSPLQAKRCNTATCQTLLCAHPSTDSACQAGFPLLQSYSNGSRALA